MFNSILRQQLAAFLGFGIVMGLVFPIFASVFVTTKPNMQLWFTLTCVMAGISMGFLNFYLVNTVLMSKIKQIATAAESVSRYDLTHSCSLRSDDLLGNIILSVNKMIENLRTMLGDMSGMSRQLSQDTASLKNVSNTAQKQADLQRNLTTELDQLLREILERLREIVNLSTSATDKAKSAQTFSDQCMEKIQTNVAANTLLADKVSASATAMRSLEEQANNIGKVLDIIRGIAEQTNLLALNAAIEAARAGETGRGFAVVADEVRSLATRTQESTTDIQKIIEKLQNESKEAVNYMTSSHEHSQESVAHSEQVAKTLQQLNQDIKDILRNNQQIATAASNQLQVTESAEQHITQLEQESNAATQEITNIAIAIAGLNQSSQQLDKLVGQFKNH